MSQLLQQGCLTVKAEVSDMFGSKTDKRRRLEEARRIIEERGNISPAELARCLGVPRSTISRDLAVADQHGVLLCEDGPDCGCVLRIVVGSTQEMKPWIRQ